MCTFESFQRLLRKGFRTSGQIESCSLGWQVWKNACQDAPRQRRTSWGWSVPRILWKADFICAHSRRPSISTIVDYIFWWFSVFLVEGWGAILTEWKASWEEGVCTVHMSDNRPAQEQMEWARWPGTRRSAPAEESCLGTLGGKASRKAWERNSTTVFGTVFSLIALQGWLCSREPKLHMGLSRNEDFQENTHQFGFWCVCHCQGKVCLNHQRF